MIDITDKQSCCGCSSCVQKCPRQCISLHEDTEGFLYPVVDKGDCIDCGLCEKVCPLLHWGEALVPMEVLAVKNKNQEERIHSSSGGVFIACLLYTSVLCIHYLIGFPWFEQRGWIIPELVVKNGIPANIWAYIIAFLTLSYLIFIIGWRKNFPCSKHEDIIRYYKGLINGNICLLMEYLDDYHKDKIQQRNRIVNGVAKDEDNKMPFESKSSKPKKKTQNLNGEVLQKVIFLPEFIEKSSSINPVFFLECVYQLKTLSLIHIFGE